MDLCRIFEKITMFQLGDELYKLHASVLILILLFQFVFTMYKLIWIKYV